MNLKKAKDLDWGGKDQIRCPICDCNYIHFNSPRYIRSYDSYGAWSEGRGDAIKIPCWCEDGHSFDLVVGFHKGNSYITYEETKEDYRFSEPVWKKWIRLIFKING